MPDERTLESALAETLQEHGLHLEETTWKRNFKKQTLTLGLKVTGLLLIQESLNLDGD